MRLRHGGETGNNCEILPSTDCGCTLTKAYSQADIPSQVGRTHLVTGANTGIGFEAASALAGCGARVLLGCRSEARGREACARIRARFPHADLELLPLDLGDLSCVRSVAERVLEEDRLDTLINNAGVGTPRHLLTKDGFEAHFGINHLGHFALTGLLLAKLEETPDARVVNVSSNMHKYGGIEWDDLHGEQSYKGLARYSMSKLANLLFAFELERRLRARDCRTMSLACHPGGALTELGRDLNPWVSKLLVPLSRPVLNTPAGGALPTLRAATDSEAKGGQYYGPRGPFEVSGAPVLRRPGKGAHNEQDAARLWAVSMQLTGVNPFAYHKTT